MRSHLAALFALLALLSLLASWFVSAWFLVALGASVAGFAVCERGLPLPIRGNDNPVQERAYRHSSHQYNSKSFQSRHDRDYP
jgi:hypothetical protein